MPAHALVGRSEHTRPRRLPVFDPRPRLPRPAPRSPPNIVDPRTFRTAHRWADDRMKAYLEAPRSNYGVVAPGVAPELRLDAARLFYANNAASRIALARAAVGQVRAHAGLQHGPVFFVTITPREFALPMGDAGVTGAEAQSAARRAGPAAAFEPDDLQALVRGALGGLAFLGMVEAALYRNWGPTGPCSCDYAAWHVHALVWGVPRARVQAALAELRRTHRSLLANASVAHVAATPGGKLERRLVYMLKAPMKEVRVGLFRESFHRTTGEVLPAGYRQQKRPLRTGDRIRLLDVMADRDLGGLLFGGGEGAGLARAIRREAREACRRALE